jgi:hypothetical protein
VTKTNLVIVLKVPNGTRGKLKLYLKAANTSSSQRNDDATAAIDPPAAALPPDAGKFWPL